MKEKKQFHALQRKLMWNSIVFSTWTLWYHDVECHRVFAILRSLSFLRIRSKAEFHLNSLSRLYGNERHKFDETQFLDSHHRARTHIIPSSRSLCWQKLLSRHRQYTTIIIISRLVFSFPRKFPPKFSNWIHSHFKQCVSELSLSEAKRSTLHSTKIAAVADEEALSN